MRLAARLFGATICELEFSLCEHDTAGGDDEDDQVPMFGFGSPNATVLEHQPATPAPAWDHGEPLTERARRKRG